MLINLGMTDTNRFVYELLEVVQVRWYWNKQPFNLKGMFAQQPLLSIPRLDSCFAMHAAVHQLDVQSRSQLMRYCEEDSNALEEEYRSQPPSS